MTVTKYLKKSGEAGLGRGTLSERLCTPEGKAWQQDQLLRMQRELSTGALFIFPFVPFSFNLEPPF